MKPQFEIRAEATFEAAHNLRQYKGKPEPLHGHSWKVEAIYKTTRLDCEDIGLDYVELEQTLRLLAKKLDYGYINQIPPFDKINPTSENIARWFWKGLKKQIKSPYARLSQVIVWEGLRCYVSYAEK